MLPTAILAKNSPALDARDAKVVDGEQVETVYKTVLDVGRFTDSMMAPVEQDTEMPVVS